MPAPQVSVVLPTRNRSTMLMQALGSALDQDGVELEVIVVDEGSSDDTGERLGAIEDRRLTVVRHDPPRGVAGARNAAIDRAAGEWVAFLDDDDIWAPGKLRRQLPLAKTGEHSLSYTGLIEIDEDGSVTRVRRALDPGGLAEGLLRANVIGTPSSVIIRADLLQRVGGFDERLGAPLEDWDLWLRAIHEGSASACEQPLVAYRKHAQNAMDTDAAKITSQLALLREKHQDAAAGARFELGEPWLAAWMASRELLDGRRLKATWDYLRYAAMERSPRDAAIALTMLGGERFVERARSVQAARTPRPDWLARYA